MNQLLKTIDVTNNGTKSIDTLDIIKADIHIIGVDSDLFFTAEENKETHKKLALTKPNVTYHEINSVHGHDAFLIEYKQLEKMIAPIFNDGAKTQKMKIVKFGGKSLANGIGLKNAIEIISNKVTAGEKITVVASARGNTTDELEEILEKAAAKQSFKKQLKAFKKYQEETAKAVDFSNEFSKLDTLFEGVKLLGDYSLKIKDEVLAQGELLSVKLIESLLKERNINAKATDARQLIITDENFGNAAPNNQISKEKVQHYFKEHQNTIPIVTGFIGANQQNQTTTL
ncbi:predicted protein, partial [Nematostella vectensis]